MPRMTICQTLVALHCVYWFLWSDIHSQLRLLIPFSFWACIMWFLPCLCCLFVDLCSFTWCAYHIGFRECSHKLMSGLIIAIVHVFDLSPLESWSTQVSLLAQNRTPFLPNALFLSFRDKSDLLIFAPSILVCLFVDQICSHLVTCQIDRWELTMNVTDARSLV